MAGNHWCLKNMIKEDTLEEIDKDRDYEKYKNYQEKKN